MAANRSLFEAFDFLRHHVVVLRQHLDDLFARRGPIKVLDLLHRVSLGEVSPGRVELLGSTAQTAQLARQPPRSDSASARGCRICILWVMT